MAAEKVAITELRAYVVCRALGHSWDDNPTAPPPDSAWRHLSVGWLALRCTRCTTERFDYIGADFAVVYRYYRYPDHYTSIPGEGTRPNLRGELIRRSILIRTYGR